MRTYFPKPEDLHTPEYSVYVKWEAEVWRLNDERNKQAMKLHEAPA